MKVTPTDKEPVLGKWSLIIGGVGIVVLVVASIVSLVRAVSNSTVERGNISSPSASMAPAGEAEMHTVLSQEEIDRQHAQNQPPPALSPVPVAAPSAVPTNRNNDEILLQKTKAKVNQRLVERLKQYVKDHPELDNRELEKEIKKREAQCTPIP